MPNRSTNDERDKLDHSSHPTSNATKDDLRAPGGGAKKQPAAEGSTGSEREPPPDDSDRVNDFFSRHGGPGKVPQRSEVSQGGLKGWSEIEAQDGHVLRCDWSRSGSTQDMKYSEVAPPQTP